MSPFEALCQKIRSRELGSRGAVESKKVLLEVESSSPRISQTQKDIPVDPQRIPIEQTPGCPVTCGQTHLAGNALEKVIDLRSAAAMRLGNKRDIEAAVAKPVFDSCEESVQSFTHRPMLTALGAVATRVKTVTPAEPSTTVMKYDPHFSNVRYQFSQVLRQRPIMLLYFWLISAKRVAVFHAAQRMINPGSAEVRSFVQEIFRNVARFIAHKERLQPE
jgi:hypothetical protein